MNPGYYLKNFEKIGRLFTENTLVLVLLTTPLSGCDLGKEVS